MLATFSGVLDGRNTADPALLRIGLNSVIGMNMSIEDELLGIDEALAKLELGIIDDGVLASHLQTRDDATFKRLRIEAKMILDQALGAANSFSLNLHFSPIGVSSLSSVQECRAIIQGAVNHLRRGAMTSVSQSPLSRTPFVDLSRIAALRAAKSQQWDLTRLIRLCEELNIAYANDCFMSVPMILRALLDHVPPLLGKETFEDVANQYAGPSSFKKSMQSLQKSLRNIADAHLHIPIRQKEVLPTGQQIDFHRDLDVLLGEIIRTLK